MTRPSSDEARRYRILEVVGEGGFGKVYRARLEGAEGFSKDVAVKLLTDLSAPEEVLQRFRDESRILGLIRDRAIVTVDPPTRLDGRWAVVMEFVDGTNCQRLLKNKPIPPRPALEIIQEVARALDNVYNQVGPEGDPLQLVHRDIKPANIQVTPGGAVKILDFGIARAEFVSREAKTTTSLAGTYGYMAPERLEGVNGAPSDVYSLGIVLGAMICGRRPSKKNLPKIMEWVNAHEELKLVWSIVEWMTQDDPDDRPTARQVEDRCAELAPTVRGGSLRRWAEVEVQEIPAHTSEDALLGNVVTETMAHLPYMDATGSLTLQTKTRRRTGALVGMGLLAMLFLVLGVGVLAAVAGYLVAGTDQTDDGLTVIEAPPPVAPVPEPLPEQKPEPATQPDPVEEEAQPEPEAPALRVEPVVPSPLAAAPVVKAAPKPRPETPVGVTYPVTFGSVPLGAVLTVDGKVLGKVPKKASLGAGAHTVVLTYGDDRIQKRIQVGKRGAVKYIWRGGDTWKAYY